MSRVSFYLGDFPQGTVKNELAESIRTQVFIEHFKSNKAIATYFVNRSLKLDPPWHSLYVDALFGGLASCA